MLIAKKIVQIVWDAIGRFSRDNGTLLGAGISFYALFSLAPLLIFGLGLVGLFLGDDAARGLIVEQIGDFVGTDVAGWIESAILVTEQSSGGVFASILGGIVVIYGAHNIFVQLRRALNVIGGIPEEAANEAVLRQLLVERAVSVLSLALMGAVFVAVTLLTLVVRFLVRQFGAVVPVWDYIATPVDFVVTLVAVTAMVGITYRVLPSKKLGVKEVLPGALFVGLVFFTVKWLLGLYLYYVSVESAYGAAGSLVVFMLWVWFTSLAYLFGAEVNEAVMASRKSDSA